MDGLFLYNYDVMITKKFKREDLINDIVGLFNDGRSIDTPNDLRDLFKRIEEYRTIYNDDKLYVGVFDILEDYELLIGVETFEENGSEYTRYIPSQKLIDNWVSYINEIEKKVLDFIPFKFYIEEYAKNNSLDLNMVKKEVNEMISLPKWSEEHSGNPLYELLQDLYIILYDESDNKVTDWRWDGSDRWFNSFLDWIKK